ncbi:MAG: serine/threonine kinase PknH [Miltoncostaeaceae bacterium]|jgi:serine/threonine-protein kinase|nr:serine/threonine kinase PknH [Miltoncostaeaceae bacterium]
MSMNPGEPTKRLPRAILPDRYRDPVPIGMGGMGEVYRAQDAELGRTVAVKVLAEALADQQEFRRRFRREAVSAARIAHPHVATVYDVGEHAGRPYLVMEYLPGGALADRIAGRPAPEDAIRWIEQTAGALDAAHARGVIHRDIKPANLLLDASGNVKVADFGIARVLEGNAGSTVTAAGTVLGTAGYLAPEQARAEPATRATDVYSLSAVAYELLTGRRPFGGRSMAAEMAAHLYEPVPPASGREPSLPPEVDAVLARGMAKEPGGRYPSAGLMAAELRTATLGAGAPAVAVAPPPPPPPSDPEPEPAPPPPPPAPERIVTRARRRSLAPVLVPLAVLVAAFGVGAAVLAGGDGGDPSRPAGDPRTTTTVERTASTEQVAERPPDPLAEARNAVDRSTALLSDGNASAALPLATSAYETLKGTGDPYEGNAAYNAGRSLVDLGRCDEAVPLLEASAGEGSESQNEVRQAALEEARDCAGGGSTGDDDDDDGSNAPQSIDEAIATTDASTAAMRDGDADQALSLAAQALDVLSGTGHPYEGNAAYNAGRSLIDLGRCGEAIPLLERSLDIGTGTKSERKIRREALKEAKRCD